ncbi:MAG: 5'-nucleotidase C-terminal domain-containing protein, partial [Bacteroidota bacterium]
LRFNNLLSLITVDAAGLRRTLEHGVSATAPGATPGQFPQVAGVRFSFDPTLPVFNPATGTGGRIRNAVVTNDSGTVILDTLVMNGVVYGNPTRTFRLIVLNFIAGGGDGYPFPVIGSNRVNIDTLPVPPDVPGIADFAIPGSEQDAFAEYTMTLHTGTPYHKAETPVTRDFRIQNLSQRPDSVFPASVSVSGTVPPDQSRCYNSIQTITAGGPSGAFLVQAGGSATMIAGMNILYQPGTKVEYSGYMHGYIAPGGPWCGGQPAALVAMVGKVEETSSFMDGSPDFVVSPNPTRGRFTIEQKGDFSYRMIRTDIYGMQGNRVYSSHHPGYRKWDCNLESNPAGLYYIRINADGKTKVLKLVVNR